MPWLHSQKHHRLAASCQFTEQLVVNLWIICLDNQLATGLSSTSFRNSWGLIDDNYKLAANARFWLCRYARRQLWVVSTCYKPRQNQV